MDQVWVELKHWLVGLAPAADVLAGRPQLIAETFTIAMAGEQWMIQIDGRPINNPERTGSWAERADCSMAECPPPPT